MKNNKKQSAYELKIRRDYGYTRYTPIETAFWLGIVIVATSIFVLQGLGIIRLPF